MMNEEVVDVSVLGALTAADDEQRGGGCEGINRVRMMKWLSMRLNRAREHYKR